MKKASKGKKVSEKEGERGKGRGGVNKIGERGGEKNSEGKGEVGVAFVQYANPVAKGCHSYNMQNRWCKGGFGAACKGWCKGGFGAVCKGWWCRCDIRTICKNGGARVTFIQYAKSVVQGWLWRSMQRAAKGWLWRSRQRASEG